MMEEIFKPNNFYEANILSWTYISGLSIWVDSKISHKEQVQILINRLINDRKETKMFDFIIDGLKKIKDEVVNGTETALETIGNIVDATLEGAKKEIDILKSDDNEPKSE